jgi:hypothetical protein
MRTVLTTLSAINGLMGVLLLGLFFVVDDTPAVVVALGIGMLVQAGYALAYLAGLLNRFEPWALRALIAGQTVALLVGGFGFISSTLHNIDPPGGDPEYGPLTVGALIAFQAAVTLWMFAVRERSRWPGVSAT